MRRFYSVWRLSILWPHVRPSNMHVSPGGPVKYLLAIYGDEEAWAAASEADRHATYAEYAAVADDLGRQGMMVDGAELQPTTSATSIRVRDGRTLVVDGPFAETK